MVVSFDQKFDSNLFFPIEPENLQPALDLSVLHIASIHEIHPYSRIATIQLQKYLSAYYRNEEFGLSSESKTFGKMFGVLVVRSETGAIGYLRAFSGKLHESNHHDGFVPPIFDSLQPDGFLTKGMTELTALNSKLKGLSDDFVQEKEDIKAFRRSQSQQLQNRIIDQYHFLNSERVSKSLRVVFSEAKRGNPPGGAGECAAPKLLQYAFRHSLRPIALAEFYWGAHSKSKRWKHKENYEPCDGKCAPILKHMLS